MKKKNVLVVVPGTRPVPRGPFAAFYLMAQYNKRLEDRYSFTHQLSTPCFIDWGRESVIEDAITQEMDYILMIDDDIEAPPDTFERLVYHNKDAVAALCFMKGQGCAPAMFKAPADSNGDRKWQPVHEYPEGLIEVDGVGFGCVLLKVAMFKRIIQPWFCIGPPDTWGEDLYFCQKAKGAGFKFHVDTTVKTAHWGSEIPITEKFVRDGKKFHEAITAQTAESRRDPLVMRVANSKKNRRRDKRAYRKAVLPFNLGG